MTSRPNHDFEKLKDPVKGNLVRPEDANYDEARKVRNAMIDRRPAVIVQCAADDVTPAIGFSREYSLPIAIRGARHMIAELSACDDGLIVDFSNMKRVRVVGVDAPQGTPKTA
jgi:FAD/FMN-containing dehydrogenase